MTDGPQPTATTLPSQAGVRQPVGYRVERINWLPSGKAEVHVVLDNLGRAVFTINTAHAIGPNFDKAIRAMVEGLPKRLRPAP